MKVLNLYAGIGGNRSAWPTECEVTAVEIESNIAAIYKEKFPQDTVVIGDAHAYLLEHFKEFDFIWSSPPCPTHSRTNYFLHAEGVIRYPDMRLYQEVLFLQNFFKGRFVVENVIPYYEPLIKPQMVGRHCLWANFTITNFKINEADIGTMSSASRMKQSAAQKKSQTERNCVNPRIGLHVLRCAFKVRQEVLA